MTRPPPKGRPEPLGREAMLGVLGQLVREVEPHTEADPVGITFASLATLGAMFGRGAYFQVEGTRHHASLFACQVGRTADGRKDTGAARAKQLSAEIDCEWTEAGRLSGLASGEGLIYALRDGDGLEDCGVADKRKLVMASEFAQVLKVIGREQNTLIWCEVLIDEFQEFFVQDDKLAQEASLLLDRLVRQGRAFGMHVVLGSQTLSGAYSLARSTMGQMGVRIALQCSEADAFLIMSEDNSAPRLLSRPGEAIYNDASGLVEGNSPFQVAWLDDPARELALQRVRQAMPAPRVPPLVFEGNRPADLAENHAFASALRAEPVPAAPGIAWLGEPISIKPPTHVSFQPQGGSNLLIVGQDEPLAAGMVLASLLSLQATVHPEIVLLDAQDRASSLATPVDRLGGRVIAVGTTSVRTLETAANLQSPISAYSGPTSLFILPGYQFKVVDAMITNFHLPESTLIMLVGAFAGREKILETYEIAIKEGYRFYSFGDAMLIL